jgi:hypothetical protein
LTFYFFEMGSYLFFNFYPMNLLMIRYAQGNKITPLQNIQASASNDIYVGEISVKDHRNSKSSKINAIVKKFKNNNYKELIIEIFCSLLANQFKLQVPLPIIIGLNKGIVPEIKENCYAFGYEYINGEPFSTAFNNLSCFDASTSAMALFDELICNADRHYNNILIDNKDNKIRWYIDHNEALTFNEVKCMGLLERNWLFEEYYRLGKCSNSLFPTVSFYSSIASVLLKELSSKSGIKKIKVSLNECGTLYQKLCKQNAFTEKEKEFILKRSKNIENIFSKRFR